MNVKPVIATALILATAADASAATHHVRRRHRPAPVAVTAAAPPPQPHGCDRACLGGHIDKVLQAMVDHRPGEAGLGTGARYVENGHAMAPGSGVWASATAIAMEGDGLSSLGSSSSAFRLYLANPQQGEAAYLGAFTENGAPAMMLLRLKLSGQLVSDVETTIVRKGEPGPFPLEPRGYSQPDGAWVKPDGDMIQGDMAGVINGYFQAMRGDAGAAPALAPDCLRIINGGRFGCTPIGAAAVRDGRVMMSDVDRGVLLVGATVETAKGAELEADLFKVRGGKVQRMQSLIRPAGPPPPAGAG